MKILTTTQDYADAMDSYDKILEITGEITGETIAPNAEGVDEEGPHCGNGRVEYASGTKQNLDAMVKAGRGALPRMVLFVRTKFRCKIGLA